MKYIAIKPEIHKFDQCEEFCKEFNVGEQDLIITNKYIYEPNFGKLGLQCKVVFQEMYATGEPSDAMVDRICQDLAGVSYNRVIGIGGGSVLDTAKLFVLEDISPVVELFEKKREPKKTKELILIPTTCGTGSEVTCISILELKSLNTKLGLAGPQLYTDYAAMIPGLLLGMPFQVFAYSSIDALIHAVESALSPNANSYTKLFAYEAIESILRRFIEIVNNETSFNDIGLLEELLVASNYAGISFGNAGAGAVHAMSYPLGGKYHVVHGEANYALFTEIMRTYQKINPDGEMKKLTGLISSILGCNSDSVFEELEKILDHLIKRKPLSEYGVTEQDLIEFTENVMTKQTRLTKTNYVPLDESQVYKIYQDLF